MRYLSIIGILAVAVPVSATDWSDDFESYTLGDSLGDYADWAGPGGPSDFFIADDNGIT